MTTKLFFSLALGFGDLFRQSLRQINDSFIAKELLNVISSVSICFRMLVLMLFCFIFTFAANHLPLTTSFRPMTSVAFIH